VNKVVLITGASSGIGLATARELARRGARLVLGSRNEETAKQAIAQLGAAQVAFRATDVAIEASSQALVALALERFGRLDAAVNNAAVEARGRVADFDSVDYARVFDTNVRGMFFAMKAQIAAMKRSGGGSIVNLSSTGGSRGMPGMAIYVASKHAVEGLSRAAALELAADHIRVNLVAPGPTLTPMLDRVTDGHPEALARRVPMGRAGTPEEVAHAIAWLVSDEASFVNGAVVPVNGGLTAA
jgi:NAD(P)-dependent dehydrogenase (short-subunit alcohol dehydrogenase family)